MTSDVPFRAPFDDWRQNLLLAQQRYHDDMILPKSNSGASGDDICTLTILRPKCKNTLAEELLARAQAAVLMNHVQSPSIPPT